MGLPQFGQGMLATPGLETMAPPSAIAVSQPALGMMGYGMPQVAGALPSVGGLQAAGARSHQEQGLFEAYGNPGEWLRAGAACAIRRQVQRRRC